MKYKDEVPREKQVTLNRFLLLPGDRILIRHKKGLHLGRVVEVGATNPEYALWKAGRLKKKSKNSDVIVWKESDRAGCEKFFRGGHNPVRIRLKKSVWAVVEYSIYRGLSEKLPVFTTQRKKLYAYDIAKLTEKEWLQNIGP